MYGYLSIHQWSHSKMGGADAKEFWAALVNMEQDPDVQLLRDGSVWRATDSWHRAFVGDPLMEYQRAGRKESPATIKSKRRVFAVALHAWIRSKIVITVKQGASLVVCEVPAGGRKSARARILDWFVTTMFRSFGKLVRDPEFRKRKKEYDTKIRAAIADKIGDRAKAMIYVDLVVTAPEWQGHGFASALLLKVTRLADLLGDACWLVSSNIANEGFYNSHGFKGVSDIILGDNNPAWDKDPVTVRLVSIVVLW
ncbi:hypothetical protein NMY22_g10662 [Coprinellus aureogranulatus]|nr:hypothetical protein NMY22_g10662 [Coprinellus aureogranulatus]